MVCLQNFLILNCLRAMPQQLNAAFQSSLGLLGAESHNGVQM